MPHKQNSHYTEYVTLVCSVKLLTSLVLSHEMLLFTEVILCFHIYMTLTLSISLHLCLPSFLSTGMSGEISALQMVLRSTISSYRLLLGTNVAALKYMKREIDTKKEDSMISYDFSVYDTSGSNAGMNIQRIEGGQENMKGKKDDGKKKKRKSDLNVGNGNAVKQNKK